MRNQQERLLASKQAFIRNNQFIHTFLLIPIIRSFLNGCKGLCELVLKSANSSGKPFSEQSSFHSSSVLIRKKLHLSRSHR